MTQVISSLGNNLVPSEVVSPHNANLSTPTGASLRVSPGGWTEGDTLKGTVDGTLLRMSTRKGTEGDNPDRTLLVHL